jgi:hypothetical protein
LAIAERRFSFDNDVCAGMTPMGAAQGIIVELAAES